MLEDSISGDFAPNAERDLAGYVIPELPNRLRSTSAARAEIGPQ